MTKIDEILAERESAIDNKIAEYNRAVKVKSAAELANIEQELKDEEVRYMEAKQIKIFAGLKEKENPILEACKMYRFEVLGHKINKTDGIITGAQKEIKERQIDLLKLCKSALLDTDWYTDLGKFNQLLTLRAGKNLGMTDAKILDKCDSIYMRDLIKELNAGKTPTSNTNVIKALQAIFDKLLFVDNGKGKNKYKVNNHDLGFIDMCYSKRSNKGRLTVSLAKTSFVNCLLMDIMYRVVNDLVYSIDGQMREKTEAEKAKAEPESAEKPAEEKPVEAEAEAKPKKTTKAKTAKKAKAEAETVEVSAEPAEDKKSA